MKNRKNVVNDLLGYSNLKIVQNPDYFSFSLDSVLLPNFININSKVKKIVDLGTGNAPIPLILSTKTKAKIFGIEIQKEIYELAKESVRINNLEGQIEILNEDIKNVTNIFGTDSVDLVFCNPPYFKISPETMINDNRVKSIARHEMLITLEDICKVSKVILKNNSSLLMVHRVERLVDVVKYMRSNNIEPKTIRFVFPKKSEDSNLFLIEGRKNSKPGLKVLTPIVAHEDTNEYSKQLLDMLT